MNELRNAHGLNEKEINKYALIYTTDKISVAKYKSNEMIKCLLSLIIMKHMNF